MAKFIFRLQGLLGIKEKLEEQRKQEYGLALAEVEREKQKKQSLLDEIEHKIAEFRQRIDQSVDASYSENYNNYIEYLKEQVKRQDKIILEAEKRADKKRLELVEAMKERKTFEKLRERKYEEYLSEQKLAEQRVVDEVVSYRFDNSGD